MKLEPIFNPHSRIGHIVKKTKQEEKDELIEQTKMNTFEKYGPKKNARKAGNTTNKTGTGNLAEDKGSFQLDEKIDAETLGIKLLTSGYMQAYIDFFYLTHPETKTPSYIEPSPAFEKEFQLNKRTRMQMDMSPASL
jgi:tetratricopeptide (TPR) repeat protein